MKLKSIFISSIILLFFSASILLFQASCKKEATAQNSTNSCIGPQPKSSFKYNGVLHNNDSPFDQRVGWTGGPRINIVSNKFEFYFDTNSNTMQFLRVLLNPGQTVTSGTYTAEYINVSSGTIGGIGTITITSIDNNYLSCTFSASIANYLVTEGQASHVIVYRL